MNETTVNPLVDFSSVLIIAVSQAEAVRPQQTNTAEDQAIFWEKVFGHKLNESKTSYPVKKPAVKVA